MEYGQTQSVNLIRPQDPSSYEDLAIVDRLSKEDLRLRHRFIINNDWELNTIATTVIESLGKILYSHIHSHGVSVLSDDDDNALNFYDLIEVAATMKINENAEKNGNINIKFRAGDAVDAIVADNVPRSEKEVEFIAADAAYSYPDDPARTEAMLKIDSIARKLVADNRNIMLPKKFQAIAACNIFIENIYRQLTQRIASGKTTHMINFNDIIEFHAIKKGDDGIEFKLRPGMGAKLIIKSDEATEADDDDGSDE